MYYNDLLELHKSGTKGTWKILNNILKRSKSNSSYPEQFVHENKEISNKKTLQMGSMISL